MKIFSNTIKKKKLFIFLVGSKSDFEISKHAISRKNSNLRDYDKTICWYDTTNDNHIDNYIDTTNRDNNCKA